MKFIESFKTNKYTIDVYENGVGGRKYYSDEIGGGVLVWDTCLVSENTLNKVIEKEREFQIKEIEKKLNKLVEDE